MYDLQRRFLIQTGHSDLQMYVQIMGTMMHVAWNFLFVVKMELGVAGTGLAASVTNLILLVGNYVVTEYTKDLEKATRVKLFDNHVIKL